MSLCVRRNVSVSERLPSGLVPGITSVSLLEESGPDILAFTAVPKEVWRQVWSNNPLERLTGLPEIRGTRSAKKVVASRGKGRLRREGSS